MLMVFKVSKFPPLTQINVKKSLYRGLLQVKLKNRRRQENPRRKKAMRNCSRTMVPVYADFGGASKIFFSRFWVLGILPILKQ